MGQVILLHMPEQLICMHSGSSAKSCDPEFQGRRQGLAFDSSRNELGYLTHKVSCRSKNKFVASLAIEGRQIDASGCL